MPWVFDDLSHLIIYPGVQGAVPPARGAIQPFVATPRWGVSPHPEGRCMARYEHLPIYKAAMDLKG